MKERLKYLIGFIITAIGLCGCRRLDTIPYSPPMSPEQFLRSHPFMHVRLGSIDFIWMQPASSVLVYFAGLYAIWVGYRFLRDQQGQRSRLWWGLGLVLCGAGAMLAGTSYQALGYELKCCGREYCTWTSWWEVMYMFLTVPGMCAMLIAATYSTANAPMGRTVIYYACLISVVYICFLMYGALRPNRFLVSFDFMAVMSAPGVLFLIWLYKRTYLSEARSMDESLSNAWLIFSIVPIIYALYMWFDIGGLLWRRGIWFTDNDVLHSGMIVWIYYIHKRLLPSVKDRRRPVSLIVLHKEA